MPANALTLPPAVPSAICETWEGLAAAVVERWNAAVADSNNAIYGSLAVGALIVMYSERPEVQLEAEKAGAGKRGPKFTPFGFVALQLSQRFGDKLPSVRHLQRCARAAVSAREHGIVKGNLHELLGWTRAKLPALADAVAIPKLPGGGNAAGGKPARLDGADFSKLVLRKLRGLEVVAQGLAARKPNGFRWTPEGLDAFRDAVAAVNRYATHLDLELVESVATRRRK